MGRVGRRKRRGAMTNIQYSNVNVKNKILKKRNCHKPYKPLIMIRERKCLGLCFFKIGVKNT